LAALGSLPLGGVRKAEAGSATSAGRDGYNPQERLHPLFGRLLGYR